jgi:hypothetical protein
LRSPVMTGTAYSLPWSKYTVFTCVLDWLKRLGMKSFHICIIILNLKQFLSWSYAIWK